MCHFIKGLMNKQLNTIMTNKNVVFFLYCRQTMDFLLFLMLSVVVSAATNKESCKDMLQGYLTGQLSSALGAYQVDALKREFKSFTYQIEKSVKAIKGKIEIDAQKMRGNIHLLNKS